MRVNHNRCKIQNRREEKFKTQEQWSLGHTLDGALDRERRQAFSDRPRQSAKRSKIGK